MRVVGGAVLAVLAAVCTGDGGRPGAPPAPPPDRLVRPGATPVDTLAADLDGDGSDEIVISSISDEADDLGIATPFLEVFDVREGRWTRVFDATGSAPPGAGAPPAMLSDDEGFVGQSVQALDAVDFAGDGRPELVAGIANFGASAGPFELWVVSMDDDGRLATSLYRATDRGGEVGVEGDRLRFEFGVYRKRDPGCCPSRFAVEIIGWDPEEGRIEVLSRREGRIG